MLITPSKRNSFSLQMQPLRRKSSFALDKFLLPTQYEEQEVNLHRISMLDKNKEKYMNLLLFSEKTDEVRPKELLKRQQKSRNLEKSNSLFPSPKRGGVEVEIAKLESASDSSDSEVLNRMGSYSKMQSMHEKETLAAKQSSDKSIKSNISLSLFRY